MTLETVIYEVEFGSRYCDHRLLLGAQHCGGQCSFVVPGVVKNET
jgi:hypothetical protein